MNLAPIATDRIRIIRRSMRCFAFGLLGVLPVVGTGLAIEALRLQRRISAELQEEWPRPPIWFYPLIGFVAGILLLQMARLCKAEDWIKGALILIAIIFMLGVQCWHLFTTFESQPATPRIDWNPGRHYVFAGVAFAYAGIDLSGGLVAGLAFWLAQGGSAS